MTSESGDKRLRSSEKNGQSGEWRCAVINVSCVAVPAAWGIICSKLNINVGSGNGHIHYLLVLSSSLSSGEEIRHAGIASYNSGGNVYTRRKHVIIRITGFG